MGISQFITIGNTIQLYINCVDYHVTSMMINHACNYFSEISLRSRIPPATPRDPVIPPPQQEAKKQGLLVYCCHVRDGKAVPQPRATTTDGGCWVSALIGKEVSRQLKKQYMF